MSTEEVVAGIPPLKVAVAELTGKSLKTGRKLTRAHIKHSDFRKVCLDYMRRAPSDLYPGGNGSALFTYLKGHFNCSYSGVINHILTLVQAGSILQVGGGKFSRYKLASRSMDVNQRAAVKAAKPFVADPAPKVRRHRAKGQDYRSPRVAGAAIAADDGDPAILDRFLATLVEMEGWVRRQKKRDEQYRKLRALLADEG